MLISDFELETEIDGVEQRASFEKQRNDLLTFLDSGTNDWIDFMVKAGEYIGESTQGRPKKSFLEKTIIGAFGFSGWREMIEAKRKVGGLGWRYSTWQEWKKAYALIKLYPTLINNKPTPAEINRLNSLAKLTAIANNELNDKGKPLQQPTLELWNQAIEQAKVKKEKVKSESIEQLKDDYIKASQMLSKANTKIDEQSIELDREKSTNTVLMGENVSLQLRLKIIEDELSLLTTSNIDLTEDVKSKTVKLNKAHEKMETQEKKIEKLHKDVMNYVRQNSNLNQELKAIESRSIIQRSKAVFLKN